MSIRRRIFFGIIILFAVVVGFLLHRIAADLDSRYRESAEETLVDFAYLLAASVQLDIREGKIDAERLQATFHSAYAKRFEAKIFSLVKHNVNLQAYITDANGFVLFDSTGNYTGRNFSQWRDVYLTLAGKYGARTSKLTAGDPGSKVMFVAAPIVYDGKIVGVVSIGKPTASQHQFITAAREKLLYVGVLSFVAFLFSLIALTVWLTRPFGLTADLIRVVRQEGIRRPARIWQRAKAVTASTFHDMRDVLTGRSHTEEYVQTLTHELKSPLTAIRGAAELLREPLPEAQRERFAANISEQVQRLQNLADRLLELAALEKRRTLDEVHLVDIHELLRDTVNAIEPAARVKSISLELDLEPDIRVDGDRFLLFQAISNILANAVDFSPTSSTVNITARIVGRYVEVSVRDRGPGIPEFALERVFEKFYSLQRPDSGRKSTGLGLAFVREVAHLHGGDAHMANHQEGGAIAILHLPAKVNFK